MDGQNCDGKIPNEGASTARIAAGDEKDAARFSQLLRISSGT